MSYSTEGIIESTLMVFICLCAILGNVSLFIIVFTNKALRTPSNYYVLSLATADLVITVISGPMTALSMLQRKWILGATACTVFGFITLLTFVSSVCNLAMIALNRYFYIVRWKTYKSNFKPGKALKYGTCVWITSLILSIPPLFGWSEIRFIEEKSYCFVHWPSDVFYTYFMVIICFFGPLSVMIVCYYKIITFTRSLKKRLFAPSGNLPNTMAQRKETKLVSNEELKLTNTLLIVVACFVICWAPFALTIFFDVYYPDPIPRPLHILSLCLGYLNSMCNPILYGVRSSNFKKGFNNLYYRCLPCFFKKGNLTSLMSSESMHDKQCSVISRRTEYKPDGEIIPIHAFYSKVSPTFSNSSEKSRGGRDILRNGSIEIVTNIDS